MVSDMVLLDYGNVEVRNSDFESLKPEGWLTGEIINFYLSYLELTEFDHSKNIVVFLGTYTAYRITNTKSISMVDNISIQLSEDLQMKEVIMIPLNHRSHWSLLVFCKVTRTFYHYDSISKYNRDFAERAVTKLMRVLDPASAAGRRTHRYYFKSMQTPQQNNDHDCGIYVLAIAEELARRYVRYRQQDVVVGRNNGIQSPGSSPLSSSSSSSSVRSSLSLSESSVGKANNSHMTAGRLSNPFSSNSFFSNMPEITGATFGTFFSPLTAAIPPAKPPSSPVLAERDSNGGGNETVTCIPSTLPRNFWRVTEEDIEYPHAMRKRLRRLILELQKRCLYNGH
ncbi:SUMO1 sentrin specific peptidase 8 [Spiromyces aspiralis]|uniref:SUMO1 sentrin specific peptidase 8 n=1 Tax=Spiromyces aspiralis TaxID=68401 RepID=A0ACC1HYD2_9FUNG|nr:SUMO1 sentrin specific peptidase 8 [Spiromyces aspiralis]